MRLAFCVLTIGLAGLPLSGQEPATPQWSRFRGPNGSGVSERTAKTCPIKAQSTAGLVGPASICNAERARFGGTSGHVGVVRRFL